MQAFDAPKWIRISFFNLLVVALLGVLMRYKIGFSFPVFDQKYLQHAHSHFAFAGWISQTLMVFMIQLLGSTATQAAIRKYETILRLHWATAAGMLVAFSLQGYGLYSISLSTFSILLSFYFTLLYVRDLKRAPHIGQPQWFVAALVWNILSTLGTFSLAWMMATRHIPQHPYLASVYWYLHFQYNGWFFFACMGLLVQRMWAQYRLAPPLRAFWLFAASCLPAYGLSTLWLRLPVWVYSLVVIASVMQFVAWLLFLRSKASLQLLQNTRGLGYYLLVYVATATTIKFCLQLGSVVPAISQLAFGFRPVVIAYLHLALLAMTTMFLVANSYLQQLLAPTRLANWSIAAFMTMVFLNEAALGMQGIASFSYTLLPYMNEILFGIAVGILVAVALLLYAACRSSPPAVLYDSNHKVNEAAHGRFDP
jgi:hypothetical protein